MSDGILDLGTFHLPENSRRGIPSKAATDRLGKRAQGMLGDIMAVRTFVRQQRYEIAEKVDGYTVNVVWPGDESHEWFFDESVGWPVEDGEAVDWMRLFRGD